MADHNVVADDHQDNKSKIVTQFLLNTCQLLQPSKHHVWAVSLCYALATRSRNDAMQDPTSNDEINTTALVTGSSAEFYIQPMLSCVGDVHIMFHRSTTVAMPEGFQPPTELPAEFHSRVVVCEMVDCEPKVPGYVLLHNTYLLTEDSDTGKFNAMPYEQSYWLTCNNRSDNVAATSEIHGPALTQCATETQSSVDIVPCVRCLRWPSQTVDWPTRHRNYE